MGHEVIIFKQGFFMQPLLNSTSSNQTWPENAGTPAKKKARNMAKLRLNAQCVFS